MLLLKCIKKEAMETNLNIASFVLMINFFDGMNASGVDVCHGCTLKHYNPYGTE